jgi:hypothetical protein
MADTTHPAALTQAELDAKCECGHVVRQHRSVAPATPPTPIFPAKVGCQPRLVRSTLHGCTCALTREQAWSSKKRKAVLS